MRPLPHWPGHQILAFSYGLGLTGRPKQSHSQQELWCLKSRRGLFIGCWSRSLCHRRCFKTNSGQGAIDTRVTSRQSSWPARAILDYNWCLRMKRAAGASPGSPVTKFYVKVRAAQETPSADGPSHFARLGSSVTRDQDRGHHGQSQQGQVGTTVTCQLLLFPSWQSLSHHSSASLLELDYY